MGKLIEVDFKSLTSPAKDLYPEDVDPDNVIPFPVERVVKATPSDLEKVTLFANYLDFPGMTGTAVNSKDPLVRVPEHLKEQTVLRLNWSYKSNAKKFKFDKEGVSAILSFGGNPFNVFVPWSAVWMIYKVDQESRAPIMESVEVWAVEE